MPALWHLFGPTPPLESPPARDGVMGSSGTQKGDYELCVYDCWRLPSDQSISDTGKLSTALPTTVGISTSGMPTVEKVGAANPAAPLVSSIPSSSALLLL